MAVSIQCPNCQATHTIADSFVGGRYRCTQCSTLIDVLPGPGAEDPTQDLRSSQDRERWRQSGMRELRSKTESYASDDGPLVLDAVDVIPPDAMLQGMASGPKGPVIPTPPVLAPDEDEPPPPRKSRLGDTEMDMTPMVDVTFQLLIFFMITAAFALQKAKEIPKPADEDPSTTPVIVQDEEASDLVLVRIDENNTFTVVNTDGDEDEAPSIQDLYIKLRRAKSGGSSGKQPTKMRVESHGDALHEKVIAALDAGNETGFAEIELTTASEEAE